MKVDSSLIGYTLETNLSTTAIIANTWIGSMYIAYTHTHKDSAAVAAVFGPDPKDKIS